MFTYWRVVYDDVMTNHRSEIFAISDEYIDALGRMSPSAATFLGIPGYDHLLDDFSVAAETKVADYRREVLARVKAMQPIDDIDRIAKEVLIERVEASLQLFDSKEAFITYGPIANPVSHIRSIFTLMNTEGDEAISNITSRLNAIGGALDSWKSTLEDMYALGKGTARRQVLGVASQLEVHGGGGYADMAKSIDPENKYPELHAAALNAQAACLSMANWMKEVHAPRSLDVDAVGAERYAPWARYFTGADLDLRATYEWGVQDLKQINDRMYRAAAKLGLEGKSLKEVADIVEESELHSIEGEDNLLAKLKSFTQEAVDRLDGVYFDIDPRIRFCDAQIAPAGSAAAPYYMPPSEDLSRPGTTWYPTLGHTRFNFWHIASTWYHEAVPGHHLQVATSTIEKDRLTRFQRTEAWISGYGEGWALYAERFMDELGAFEDPAYELGFLSGQALRAARIIVDIGMHCGYEDFDGNVWNAQSAFDLLVNRALLAEDFARSEVDRYLGWPGQAISYKVGERVWVRTREDAKKRLGDKFDIKAWHNYALKIGPMGLDPFEREMATYNG
jgi:uncharacterized protein (DUF885 family)